jgi:hypothetical protein
MKYVEAHNILIRSVCSLMIKQAATCASPTTTSQPPGWLLLLRNLLAQQQLNQAGLAV